MFGHVTRELSAYCHGELSTERARRVRSHLDRCAPCRRDLEEIRRGVALAGHLAVVPAPESLWRGIESRLRGPALREERRRSGRFAFAGSLLLSAAATAAFGLWYSEFRRPLDLVAASRAPSELEVVARKEHALRVAGKLSFDTRTDSPEVLREWTLRHTDLDVELAERRPAEDSGRFRAIGAKLVGAAGAQAVLVGYEVDGRPVTLLAAPLRDVRDPPAHPWFQKRVFLRSDAASGLKLLTWGASGQAYVLVSDLPGRGTDACGICHTASDRRELIRKAPLRTDAGRP
jgi:putative zinc finger protein